MQRSTQLRDGWLRLIGIPGFAVSIPLATSLFGPYGPLDATFWLGLLWFLLLATLIWHGNRWLLFRQRDHVDWFAHPLRKLTLLLAGVMFGTVPVTLLMLLAWFRLAALPVDWSAIKLTVAVNVICVVFVTHVYETVFLVKEREADLLEVERLDRARAEAELEALRAQIDPHFLFNCLNTLGYLIGHDANAAREFNAGIARVYRYILASRGRALVLLDEEFGFFEDYLNLLRVRFGPALRVHIDVDAQRRDRMLLPPIALQVLLENAVKHNAFSRSEPLDVHVLIDGDALVLRNPRNPRQDPIESAGVGLKNLAERYRRTTGRDITIVDAHAEFLVRLPLLAA